MHIGKATEGEESTVPTPSNKRHFVYILKHIRPMFLSVQTCSSIQVARLRDLSCGLWWNGSDERETRGISKRDLRPAPPFVIGVRAVM